jgi:hypothetical protein
LKTARHFPAKRGGEQKKQKTKKKRKKKKGKEKGRMGGQGASVRIDNVT